MPSDGAVPRGRPLTLHPLSVPYRSLAKSLNLGTLVFLGTVVGSGSVDPTSLGIVGLTLAYLSAMGAFQAAYYRRFQYVLTGDTLDITSGVFSRRRREIPLRRVQNVDVSQNPVQRALGIAAVNIETAGGGDTEASLRYVGRDRATALKRELRGRAGDAREERTEIGEGTDEGTTDPGAVGPERLPDETVIFELPTRNLLLLSAFTVDTGAGVISSTVAALSSGGDPRNVFLLRGVIERLPGGDLQATALVIGAVALAAWLLSVVITFARYYGFRLVRVGDELEYERGLLQRYSGTIPLEKVQTLSIHENPLKRRFGYATLLVETAGYGPNSGGGSKSAVPLARRERALSIARQVEGVEPPEIERPPRRARERYAVRFGAVVAAVTGALYVATDAVGFLAPPAPRLWLLALVPLALAPVAAHLRWIHRGHAVTPDHFVARTGFWSRTTRIVPYFRIQTVEDTRTIFQRRRHLASVTADTASSRTIGGSGATAIDVDGGVATDLRETLAGRLQENLVERRRERSRRAARRGDADAEPDRAEKRDRGSDRGDREDAGSDRPDGEDGESGGSDGEDGESEGIGSGDGIDWVDVGSGRDDRKESDRTDGEGEGSGPVDAGDRESDGAGGAEPDR